MVPTVGARGPWRPAKFCAPEYHGLVEQTPLFQVHHQCCQRLIDLSTQTSMPLFQVTVSIPSTRSAVLPVKDLHEAYTPLNEPPCGQTDLAERLEKPLK